jgi:hypothetical protein
MMAMWLAGSVCAWALTLVVHAASGRLVHGNAILRFVLIGCVFGLGLGVGLGVFYGLTVELLTGMLLYGLGCELYIFVFTLSLYSISANLLIRLRANAMTAQQVDALYDSGRMVELRLNRLVHKNLLYRDGDRLCLTGIGLRLATVFHRFGATFRTIP